MVFFCCSVCGDSLKKNQVQKHYSRCRMDMVSCMDCSVEFWNDDYQQHIKCISEEEKYSGKDYKPRPGQNKGEVKQDAWLQQVQKAIDNCSPSPKLRNLLEKLKDYPNIPRKQAKFLNFIKNSLRISDAKLASSVWEILMSASPPKEENTNGKENGVKKDDNNNNNKNKTEEKNGEEKDDCLGGNSKVEEEEEEEGVTKKTKKMSKREKKEERRKERNKMEKKDSKKQKSDSKNIDDNNVNDENERQSKKKGKKRKRNDDDEDVYAQRNGEKEPKKKKKSNKKQKDDDDDEDCLPPLEPNPNHAGFEADQEEEEEGEEEEDPKPKKKKPKNQKFDWEQIILSLLSKSKEKSMSEKKLRKKVLAEYVDQGCHVDSMSLLKAKFDRKIKKNSQFVRQKDQVKLID